MYTFLIKTDKKEYAKYNGKPCWVINMRDDGYVEVYVLGTDELILLRPSELED